ncbi:MAG: pyridoxal phosphate-dependent aminotransferase [Proteobacteria bacterium]|nr:pyridoxal phosphate-dependent aminotransferase [Pseudomonadota bacterium]
MAISQKIQQFMENASWIRKMFEEGAALRKEFGEKNVFDLSLGNPNLEPPEKFFEVFAALATQRMPGRHGYMSNAGYHETRDAVAEYLSEEHGKEIFGRHIIMTCGAGGALNVVLKTLLDPGDEVVISRPYFVEYNFYIDNYQGVSRPVKTKEDFSLDLYEIEAALSPKTRAVLINSPNNPTGRVYNKESITGLARLLENKSREFGKEIYLISDEPYNKIVYDGVTVPSILAAYRNSVLITSYSKDLSIPGERLGFIAVNPDAAPLEQLINGMIFCNRTLGFVNAPAFAQRVVQQLQGMAVDVAIYQRKRDLLCTALQKMGYRLIKPEGAFYLFPQTPINDIEFVRELQQERILTVPGNGFGSPGFFRIAYCVEDWVIEGALAGFKKLADKYFK